jgi:hypothetical protein
MPIQTPIIRRSPPAGAPEPGNRLLEGFKELLSDLVPRVASAAVEPTVRAAQGEWTKELATLAKQMQDQLDASLLLLERNFRKTEAHLVESSAALDQRMRGQVEASLQKIDSTFGRAEAHLAQSSTSVTEGVRTQVGESLQKLDLSVRDAGANLAASSKTIRSAVAEQCALLASTIDQYRKETNQVTTEINRFTQAAHSAVSDAVTFGSTLAQLLRQGRVITEQTGALLDRHATLNTEMNALVATMIGAIQGIHTESQAILQGVRQLTVKLDANVIEYATRLQEYTQDLADLIGSANDAFQQAQSSLVFGLKPRPALVLIIVLHVLEIAAAIVWFGLLHPARP